MLDRPGCSRFPDVGVVRCQVRVKIFSAVVGEDQFQQIRFEVRQERHASRRNGKRIVARTALVDLRSLSRRSNGICASGIGLAG